MRITTIIDSNYTMQLITNFFAQSTLKYQFGIFNLLQYKKSFVSY